MTKAIHPFRTNKHLVGFAQTFVANRVQFVRKDVGICLRPKKRSKHAYFPALMSCIGFLDLMSGLYAGKLRGHGLVELIDYFETFVNAGSIRYSRLELAVVYEAFRHKLAHLGHPYVVYNTATFGPSTKNLLGSPPSMRLAWTVDSTIAGRRPIEIEVERCVLRRTPTPWPVAYDHRVFVSIERLMEDGVNSALKRRGYLARLRNNRQVRERFAACMRVHYPP